MNRSPVLQYCLPTLLSTIIWLGLGDQSRADSAKIAIAANFTTAAKTIKAQFERDTSHQLVLIFGSTGKLYAQIYYGAPFDVFLSADQVRPQKAVSQGLAIANTRFTYALGKIVLYSSNPDLVDASGKVLSSGKFSKLAIANPDTAPYGMAAKEVLIKLGLYDKLVPKIVRGENIAQTYQFIMTGNAQLGFIAASQMIDIKNGSKSIIPDLLYSPIKQDAVLLKHGARNKAAKAFLHYLKGEKARAILKKYGYAVEE